MSPSLPYDDRKEAGSTYISTSFHGVGWAKSFFCCLTHHCDHLTSAIGGRMVASEQQRHQSHQHRLEFLVFLPAPPHHRFSSGENFMLSPALLIYWKTNSGDVRSVAASEQQRHRRSSSIRATEASKQQRHQRSSGVRATEASEKQQRPTNSQRSNNGL
ncbi:hypothetical protein LINPERHAP2_LOCUS7061 [Linum perenne]